MSTEKYLLPNQRKRLEEAKGETFGSSNTPMPTSKNELTQLLKDAPKIKAVEKDIPDLWKKAKGEVEDALNDLIYDKVYGKAYSAGYEGDNKVKNPFKKNTLAYWLFDNQFEAGAMDN